MSLLEEKQEGGDYPRRSASRLPSPWELRRLGAYRLGGVVGRGPAGCVYRVGDDVRCRIDIDERASTRGLVIKLIALAGDHLLAQAIREDANRINGLCNRAVLPVIDVVEQEDVLGIVAPFAEGGALARRLSRPQPHEEVLSWAVAVAEGLAAAHSRGVVHGGLSESNVLFDGFGRAVVSDFSVALRVAEPSVWGGMTVGVCEHLDPEVAGGADPSVASDIYSLGVVCYRALSGRYPYDRETPLATLRASRRGRAVSLRRIAPGVPQAVADLVHATMAVFRDNRPASATELAAALQAEGLTNRGKPARQLSLGYSWGRYPEQAPRSDLGDSNTPARDPVLKSPPKALPLARNSIGSSGLSGQCAPVLVPDPLRARRRARLPWLHALAIAVLVLFGTAATLRLTARSRGSTSAAHLPAQSRCVTGAKRSAPPPLGAVIVSGDVRGDGCIVQVVWAGNTAEVVLHAGWPPEHVVLGIPGDRLLLGNWYCTGRSVPALYRPSTGEVVFFSGWPSGQARDPTPSPVALETVQSGVAWGSATTARVPGRRCQEVRVVSAGAS